MSARRTLAAALALVTAHSSYAAHAEPPISARDSFTLGSRAGVQCRAASRAEDPGAPGVFDRAYRITCRDAAVPVGSLYVLRGSPDRLTATRATRARCAAPVRATDLAGATVAQCRLLAADAAYRVYAQPRGRLLFVAEGLAGYDDALRLGLRTLIADRPVAGTIAGASTAATDAAQLARVQAAQLDATQALAEGYRRNNSGDYSEAAAFFDTPAGTLEGATKAEFLLGAALQRSDLGDYAGADTLFAHATDGAADDPVTTRLLRNFRAIHLLNQRRGARAYAVLTQPVPPVAGGEPVHTAEIDAATASRLNRGINAAPGTRGALTPAERARVLDAQAQALEGVALRLIGKPAEAKAVLEIAVARFETLKGQRVVSVARLESSALGELAQLAEARGDMVTAGTLLRRAIVVLDAEYPSSLATLAAKGRLGGFLARQHEVEPAMAIFAEVVAGAAASGSATPGLAASLNPYFALLADQAARGRAVAQPYFAASQLLLRPGVAQTQSVLARALSGGTDEASRLFRQAIELTRESDRARLEIVRLSAIPVPDATQTAALGAARARLAQIGLDQTVTSAELARFPRYRAVSTQGITLAALQAALRPGEAYMKITVGGPRTYALWIEPTRTKLYPVASSTSALAISVARLRASIVAPEGAGVSTPPFNVPLSARVFADVFGPVADRLAQVRHLIYEPDGALLRLPPTVLVTDLAAADAFARSPAAARGDYRGLPWLGRSAAVSTSVGPRAFVDLRGIAPSRATEAYIGFGQNVPLSGAVLTAAAERGAVRGPGTPPDSGCAWPSETWNHPISADELRTASALLAPLGGSTLVTGPDFTDTAITARTDLANYRVLHFATHGFVTAPRPECPARPALLTSFGAGQSEGLLTFAKIFDLHLDADLIVLSACDTAGAASVEATREAGVTSGGDFALDGLVRAFVGAGGRVVVASHWPVPDSFNATKRLIGGLFTAPAGTGVAEALRMAQAPLMDGAETSHPFYWAAFAVVGDGARPVTRKPPPAIADKGGR